MNRIFLLICAFSLLACEADPGLKKWPKGDPRFVSKGVDVDFFPLVDILFVIDDSGSMDDFQSSLSSNVDEFIDTIFQSQFIDYHIGVTTSNDSENMSVTWDGRLISTLGPNYVERNTPSAKRILRNYLKPGSGGDGDEKFFSMVRDALSQPLLSTTNVGFYRDKAHLLVFFLTDAEDQSDLYSPNQFHQFLLNLKNGDSNKIHFAAATVPTVGGSCSSFEDPAHRIEEFTRLVNGKIFSICDADYGIELVKVAHDIIERVSTIELDEVPVVSSIKISFGSQVIPRKPRIGWTYNPDNNTIYLGRDLVLLPEPVGTELSLSFEAAFK